MIFDGGVFHSSDVPLSHGGALRSEPLMTIAAGGSYTIIYYAVPAPLTGEPSYYPMPLLTIYPPVV